jgi:hypothetical protein
MPSSMERFIPYFSSSDACMKSSSSDMVAVLCVRESVERWGCKCYGSEVLEDALLQMREFNRKRMVFVSSGGGVASMLPTSKRPGCSCSAINRCASGE